MDATDRHTQAGSGDEPYIVVSTDNHAGPALVRQLRDYCPSKYLDDFDAFARQIEAAKVAVDGDAAERFPGMGGNTDPGPGPLAAAAYQRCKECPGQQDPAVRVHDMDADGIAAEVIFAGGLNDETLPFVGFGVGAASTTVSAELVAVGCRIWNQWLSDFTSGEPERHVGVMQVPIFDIDASVREVEWGRAHGLGAVNLPAPRSDFTPYTEPEYDPLWAACEALRLPLGTHSGGGEQPLGATGSARMAMLFSELHWLGRRGLWQLIFGGVFDRYPGLKFFFAEQRADWVPYDLRHLDSVYYAKTRDDIGRSIKHKPSDYWHSNCYNSGSFLSRFEVAMRDEIGIGNLMWGSDYPHAEGAWPHSKLSIRHTFHDVPQPEVRQILGENAIGVFGLDAAALRTIADRIGPTPQEVAVPPDEEELPDWRAFAYREIGTFA